MQIKIELTREDLKMLIQNHIEAKVNHSVDIKAISILTKSAQNYRSEWEKADFKAEYNTYTKEV